MEYPVRLQFAPVEDVILRRPARMVTEEEMCSASFADFIRLMGRVVTGQQAMEGQSTMCMVGLAAPQVGVDARVIAFNSVAERGPSSDEARRQIRIFVNPSIVVPPDTDIVMSHEGCFSAPPNCRAWRPRYSCVWLSGVEVTFPDGLDPGSSARFHSIVDEIVVGNPAIRVQHECDHLDGKRMLDDYCTDPPEQMGGLLYVPPDLMPDYRRFANATTSNAPPDSWLAFPQSELDAWRSMLG